MGRRKREIVPPVSVVAGAWWTIPRDSRLARALLCVVGMIPSRAAAVVVVALTSLALPARADTEPYTVAPGQRVEKTLTVPCALQFDITNKVPTSLDEQHLAWAVAEGKDWSGGNPPVGTYTAAFRDYKLKVYAATGYSGEKGINGGWNPALVYTVRAEVKATYTRYLVMQNGTKVSDVSINSVAPSKVTLGYGWPPSVRKGATDAVLTKIQWEQGPPAPPPPATKNGQYAAVADSFADPGTPSVALGASPELRTGGDGRTVYLRFAVAGVGSIASARVLLEAMNGGGGGEIRFLPDNTWSESGLTWANRPVPTGAALASLGKVEVGAQYSFDVTSAVPGDGTYSFAITSNDPDGSGFHSRESAVAQPILEVVAGPHPTPPPDAGQPPPVVDAGTEPPDGPGETPGWADAGGMPPKLIDAGAPAEATGLESADGEPSSCAFGSARGATPGSPHFAPWASFGLLALLRGRRRYRSRPR